MEFNVDDYLNETAAMRSDMEKLQKLQHERSSDMLDDAFKRFFEATPDIVTVTWRQYTPYFNDGDSCYFSVQTPTYFIDRGDEEDDREFDDDGYGDVFNSYTLAEIDAAITTVTDLLLNHANGHLVDYNNAAIDWKIRYNCFDYAGSVQGYTFNPEKANNYLRGELDQTRKEVLSEIADYPDREQSIKNWEMLKKFIESISDDVMEKKYEDHVRVIVTANGATTEEISHD